MLKSRSICRKKRPFLATMGVLGEREDLNGSGMRQITWHHHPKRVMCPLLALWYTWPSIMLADVWSRVRGSNRTFQERSLIYTLHRYLAGSGEWHEQWSKNWLCDDIHPSARLRERMSIEKRAMIEHRWGAVFPGVCEHLLMLDAFCSLVALTPISEAQAQTGSKRDEARVLSWIELRFRFDGALHELVEARASTGDCAPCVRPGLKCRGRQDA